MGPTFTTCPAIGGCSPAPTGHVVDVAVLVTDRANARIDQVVADVVDNRATIEQAKGALARLRIRR